jgi:hypothetical protein
VRVFVLRRQPEALLYRVVRIDESDLVAGYGSHLIDGNSSAMCAPLFRAGYIFSACAYLDPSLLLGRADFPDRRFASIACYSRKYALTVSLEWLLVYLRPCVLGLILTVDTVWSCLC